MNMKNFTQIPNEILSKSKLSIQTRYLYCVMRKYCRQKNSCYPSQKTLAKDLGLCIRQVWNITKKLEDAGLIVEKKRRGFNKTNIYKLADISESEQKYTSSQERKSSSFHSRSGVLNSNGSRIQDNNTNLIIKDINIEKGVEKLRKKMEELNLK